MIKDLDWRYRLVDGLDVFIHRFVYRYGFSAICKLEQDMYWRRVEEAEGT